MNNLNFRTCCAAIAVLGFIAPFTSVAAPLTNGNIDSRTTTRNISFSDLTFAGSVDLVTMDLRLLGGIGDSGTFGISNLGLPTTGYGVTSGSGISLSGVIPPDAAGNARFTATIVGPSDQTIHQTWLNQTGLPGQGFNLTHDSSSGFHTLEFLGGGSGFLKAGGTFVFVVNLPGDWSVSGSGTGQYEFLGINPAFTVIENFVYDPMIDATQFMAVNANYSLASPNVNMHFVLHGAPVPEPTSAALVLAGLGSLAFVRRRRGHFSA